MLEKLKANPNTPYFAGFACAFVLVAVGTWLTWGDDDDGAVIGIISQLIEGGEPTACGVDCATKIKTERRKILAIEPGEAKYVLTRYNEEYTKAGWPALIKKCSAHRELLKEMSERTLYPESFLGGFAVVEGMCREQVVSGDGGHGLFQITTPDRRNIRDAALAMGVDKSDFDYAGNVRHNAMLGTIMLDSCETSLKSRGPGILCYNRGLGGTRKDMKRAGWAPGKLFTISDFRGAIPDSAGKGGRPRIYVDRILAAAVAYDRAVVHGLELAPLKTLTLAEIPGADPALDGESITITHDLAVR